MARSDWRFTSGKFGLKIYQWQVRNQDLLVASSDSRFTSGKFGLKICQWEVRAPDLPVGSSDSRFISGKFGLKIYQWQVRNQDLTVASSDSRFTSGRFGLKIHQWEVRTQDLPVGSWDSRYASGKQKHKSGGKRTQPYLQTVMCTEWTLSKQSEAKREPKSSRTESSYITRTVCPLRTLYVSIWQIGLKRQYTTNVYFFILCPW